MSDTPHGTSMEGATGWDLVPYDPTTDMLKAAQYWSSRKYGKPIGNDAAIGCYHAMLAVSPKPPAKPSRMEAGGVARARAEALEEAAKVVENYGSQIMPDQLTDEVMKLAAAIRSLATPAKESP